MKRQVQSIRSSLLVLLILISSYSLRAQGLIEPMDTGRFEPTWESLQQYSSAPEWYRDAKFGIWAHWGPQCQPEQGDWFARFMYYPGSQRDWFNANYGTSTALGFKDVINSWKAQNWDPDSIVKVYKNAGAMYFFVMGNHHDNLDMWDSKYQEWNTVNVGPKKDILDGWEKAARANNLKFGVSIHASHAWSWLEPSQSYDGNLTEADSAGKWWAGLDPQELYAQNHVHSTGWDNSGTIHSQWNWVNGASIPSAAYCNKFYNRTLDMIKRYNPDLIYFDDTSLPFVAVDNAGNRSTTTVSDVGLKIAASYYNKGANSNGGKVNNVIFGKILTENEKECLVWDVERGIPDRPQDKPWQTCTCIGDWHYNRSVYNNNSYKSAKTVIHMLVDIVSKNGNLLLNVPLRGDGTYDEKELAIVQGITAWMNVNKESIYSTRPWITFGEGPTAEAVNPLSAQGFNEGTTFTAKDVRYVCKNDTVFVTVMGWPETNKVTLKSLSTSPTQYLGNVKKVELLGTGEVTFTRDFEGLKVSLPAIPTSNIAFVLKVQFDSILYSYSELEALIAQSEDAVDSANLKKGLTTGNYIADSIQIFVNAINTAKLISAGSNDSIIKDAILTLHKAFYHFSQTAILKGGLLTFQNTQDITGKTMLQARNFSRSDAGALGTGRWGLLGEPWVYTNNIVNQENNSRGGFDNYNSGKSIGVQKWNASDAAITNGMIYQTTKLPAGQYSLKIKVHENYGLLASEIYLNVTKGKILPTTANVISSSISYYDMSNSVTGNQYTVCNFTLDSLTEVSIGWTVSIPASASNRSMRVNEILLLDNAGTDISADYLANYTNIQRKDMSFSRFGIPANWTVENFNIPQSNGDGTKRGIDRYPGFNTLMMGVWDDAASSAGNLKDVKIYKNVTLPAGHYALLASYETLYNLANMYMFVSTVVPTLTDVKESSIAFHPIYSDANNGQKYGLEFSLAHETSLYLGWVGDLTDAKQQEFRVKELSLVRVLASDTDYLTGMEYDASMDSTYIIDMSEFEKVTNLTWTATLDNLGYLNGNTSGEIVIGDVDFGEGLTKNFFVKTAFDGTLPANAKYDFYKNNETTPFVSVPALNTGGTQYFDISESEPIQLNGVHRISLKYYNHASNITSAGFKQTEKLVTDCKGVLGGKAFIDSCGICVDTLNGEIACETSIKDKKNIVLGIWPNPFTKEFILQTESPSEFIITNLSGMGIVSGTCNKTCKIGASLQSGVYFLTVSALSRQKTVKIIKME